MIGRVYPYLFALLFLGIAIYAAHEVGRDQTLACERATDRCTWTDKSPLRGGVHREFAVAAVLEVRFVDRLGKHHRNARPVLVFTDGSELALHSERTSDARARFEALQAFFAGRTASVRVHTHASRWLFLVVIAIVAGAVGAVVRTAGRPRKETVAAPAKPRDWRRTLIIGALVVGTSGAIMLALWLTARGQGTLAIECTTRCRFNGLECRPGGEFETTLDPGNYTVEVWAAAGSALWLPRPVTISAGQTTRFACEP